VAETESGLDVMRSRMKRAARTPPPPRRPADDSAPVPPAPARDSGTDETPSSTVSQARRPGRAREGHPGLSLAPNAPAVNLAIRVRRPLDDRLVEIIHALRREDVRSSKVEIIEMLLWELPDAPDSDLRRRLSAFRKAAPRGSGSPAEL